MSNEVIGHKAGSVGSIILSSDTRRPRTDACFYRDGVLIPGLKREQIVLTDLNDELTWGFPTHGGTIDRVTDASGELLGWRCILFPSIDTDSAKVLKEMIRSLHIMQRDGARAGLVRRMLPCVINSRGKFKIGFPNGAEIEIGEDGATYIEEGYVNDIEDPTIWMGVREYLPRQVADIFPDHEVATGIKLNGLNGLQVREELVKQFQSGLFDEKNIRALVDPFLSIETI